MQLVLSERKEYTETKIGETYRCMFDLSDRQRFASTAFVGENLKLDQAV